MIFTAYWFLIFIVFFLVAFYACAHELCRSLLLAFASLLFYAHFAGAVGVLPILVLGSIVYIAARIHSLVAINCAMLICLASLLFYKYTLFLSETLVQIFPLLKSMPVSVYAPAAAPLAISFFVFEFVHYLYDVKKGNAVIKSPLEFFHFAMFFPTLVAGPVKRYEQFIPSLKRGMASASILSSDFQIGFLRVVSGFAKKLVADSLTLYINTYDSGFASYPLSEKWTIFTFIAMRIYLDFSGYSDMAIGFARMMGIQIPENFNWPYLATSIKEFWHRWHISLSSWIRDYIYIPLGGSRVGATRQGLNMLFVFFVCGLWHGAAWNFVLWGIYHGCGLIIQQISTAPLQWVRSNLDMRERTSRIWLSTPGQLGLIILNKLWVLCGWALTTLFVWSGWLLFFYSPEKAMTMFISLFSA